MKWISAKERLSELEITVLAYVKVGMKYDFKGWKDERPTEIITGYFSKSYGSTEFFTNCECSGMEHDRERFEVLAWMPLPEVPK